MSETAEKPGEGRKDDTDKPEWSLLPLDAMEQVVAVLMYGKKKYSAENWKKVPDARNRYWDATLRHMLAWKRGNKTDESGLPALAHAVCSLLFLLWFDSEEGKVQEEPTESYLCSCGAEMVPVAVTLGKEDRHMAWFCPKCQNQFIVKKKIPAE